MSKVMIQESDYQSCQEAVDRAFDLFPLSVSGKSVLVKPNVLRSSQAGEGIVTHPAVLKAVLARLKRMGPKRIVVGDNPGAFTYGANEEAFAKTGLAEAAGEHYLNLGTDSRKVGFNPEFQDSLSVSSAVLEADVVISLPKFKTHGLTIVTGAIKNSFGILPGAQKASLHRIAGTATRFHELIVDVFQIRVPDLFIMDAVVGMEGNGPASPDLREIGLVLASDNAVALDATVARMMGVDPGLLRFLVVAKERGLGDFAEESIELLGRLTPLQDFKLPPLGGELAAGSKEARDFLLSREQVRPKADPELCTGCGLCMEQCPVSALSMPEEVPVVDPEKCIACFCCQEMCPEKAMQLS